MPGPEQRWRAINSTTGVAHLICDSRGPIPVPPGIVDTIMEQEDDRLIIKQPLLGFQKRPRLPLTLFLSACGAVPGLNGRELFDRIHQANTLALVNLLRLLEPMRCATAELLRIGCFNQLTALSAHIGHGPDLVALTEEISTPFPPLPADVRTMGRSPQSTR